jgi:hypothetical protein
MLAAAAALLTVCATTAAVDPPSWHDVKLSAAERTDAL